MTPIFFLSSLKDPLFSLFSLSPKDPYFGGSCPHIPVTFICECPPRGTAPIPGKCPVSANTIASQLLQNGRFTNPDLDFSRQVGKEAAKLWKVYSKDVKMSTPFTTGELVEAIKSMKAGKASGPDDIHPGFLLPAGDAATKWLCQYMSTS